MRKAIDDFLASTGWANASQSAIASDASARRYLRLEHRQGSAMLMIAPPKERGAFDAFQRISQWLCNAGFSAPEVYAADANLGLMLIEDFGDALFSTLAIGPQAEVLYAAAGDVIAALEDVSPPDGVASLDSNGLVNLSNLALDEIPDQARATALRAPLEIALRQHLAPLAPPGPVALRDLHAGNLLWLEGRDGLRRVGLLDFQDAVIAPPGYDLASLVDDPRREVPLSIRDTLIVRHATARGIPVAELKDQIDRLSLARNIRILGIFRRIARLRERPQYLSFLPRTAALLRRAAGTAPVAEPLSDLLDGYGL